MRIVRVLSWGLRTKPLRKDRRMDKLVGWFWRVAWTFWMIVLAGVLLAVLIGTYLAHVFTAGVS